MIDNLKQRWYIVRPPSIPYTYVLSCIFFYSLLLYYALHSESINIMTEIWHIVAMSSCLQLVNYWCFVEMVQSLYLGFG
jgi:hypothetical protein